MTHCGIKHGGVANYHVAYFANCRLKKKWFVGFNVVDRFFIFFFQTSLFLAFSENIPYSFCEINPMDALVIPVYYIMGEQDQIKTYQLP